MQVFRIKTNMYFIRVTTPGNYNSAITSFTRGEECLAVNAIESVIKQECRGGITKKNYA